MAHAAIYDTSALYLRVVEHSDNVPVVCIFGAREDLASMVPFLGMSNQVFFASVDDFAVKSPCTLLFVKQAMKEYVPGLPDVFVIERLLRLGADLFASRDSQDS